jgi:ABC-type antimicrobial peptide transport system permease subunit
MALQRRREIGVRMAVGATARHVIELIVSQGLRLTAVGVAIGLVAAMAIAGLLRSLLFGVQPFDVPTMAGVATGMLLVGIVACLVPAWRASHLDPNDVLRADA